MTMSDFLKNRRNFMTAVAGAGGAALGIQTAQAADELRFPGDKPKHHVVYQINKNDPEYQTHILNSMSAMITEFGGNVQIAVVAFAAGIHLLAKSPQKTVNPLIYERVKGFSENYGVVWDACGNTMHTVQRFAKWAQRRSWSTRSRVTPISLGNLPWRSPACR
jgi:hypothetical protein